MISPQELLDVVIMSGALGFIFMDMFKKPNQDPLMQFSGSFNWDDFWYACKVIAPCIILHEMAHKFLALGFGGSAVFHAAYTWLAIGIGLKLLGTGFVFFVPGFVAISGISSHFQYALIAFAGPFMHLILWLGARQYLLSNAKISQGKRYFLGLIVQINKWLFILNMLPIPGFDGFSVYRHLFLAFA